MKKATELNPHLSYVHAQLGDVYRDLGEYELAVIRYRLALGDHPDDTETWLKLGQLYLAKEEVSKAQNAFQKALDINPNLPEPHMHLGLFYLKEGRYLEAANEFKSVTTLEPFNELAWLRLGTVNLMQAEQARANSKENARDFYEKAQAAFLKAKEVNPAFADALFNLGLTYLKQDKRNEARKEWEQTLVVEPQHARTLYNLATLYQLEGKNSRAYELFCRFVKTPSDQFPAEKEAAKRIMINGKYSCRD